jgi:hypothetical protein
MSFGIDADEHVSTPLQVVMWVHLRELDGLPEEPLHPFLGN